jgi:hypothetical protein
VRGPPEAGFAGAGLGTLTFSSLLKFNAIVTITTTSMT